MQNDAIRINEMKTVKKNNVKKSYRESYKVNEYEEEKTLL